MGTTPQNIKVPYLAQSPEAIGSLVFELSKNKTKT